MEHCFRALFTTSLGIALVLFPLYLLYRACEKRLAPKYANDLFGAAYAALWVVWYAKCVWPDELGLLPFGPAYAPEAALREAPAAGPGWLEVAAWVWLAGIAAYLLSRIVPYARFRLRVRRESRPASAETQRAFDRLLGGDCLLGSARRLGGISGWLGRGIRRRLFGRRDRLTLRRTR